MLWVRHSYERVQTESLFPSIRPMTSFRETLPAGASGWRTIPLETELVPLALVQRYRKSFVCGEVAALDGTVARVRAFKSPYALALMARSGAMHQRLLEEQVPSLLLEGINEAEFACDLNT